MQEGQLQMFLRKLWNKGFFNEDVYKSVYPTGSRPTECTASQNYIKYLALYQYYCQ